MDKSEVVSRFNNLYLGDSILDEIFVETAAAQCRLRFNAGKVLKGEGANIFDPESQYEPAQLRLAGVKAITFEGGAYQLNSTVVDFGAALSGDGAYVEFYFDLTGGTDSESFMVTLKILALDFEFGP